MKKPGFSVDGLWSLRQAAKQLIDMPAKEQRARAVQVVRVYLEDARQTAARCDASASEDGGARSVLAGVADWLTGAAKRAKLSDADEEWLSWLLKAAREDRLAYDIAKPVIAELIAAGILNEVLLSFVADDYAGKLKPRGKTRRTSPRDHFRQMQVAFSSQVMKEAGLSERAAFAIVAEAAALAGVRWPKTYGAAEETVTPDHVRAAYRRMREKYSSLR